MFVETQIILIFLLSLFTLNILQNKVIRLFVSFFFSIFLILEIISYYLTGELIDYRFFIHTDISSIKVFYFQFKKEVFFLPFLIIIINYSILKIKLDRLINFKKTNYIILVSIFLLIFLPNKSAIKKIYEINKIYNNNNLYKEEITGKKKNIYKFSNFIDTNNLKDYNLKEDLKSKKKYNIIFLIVESIDSGFLDKTPKLTPNLNILKEEWYFKKIQDINGCSWSSGNLYCLMTGLPAYFPFEKNKIFQGLKELDIITLGDIFDKSDYDFQEFFVGESNFVGTKDLLETMNFKVFDNSNSTGNYRVYPKTFGFHDKDLFYELKKRIKNLKSTNSSFTIFASTINTHLNGIKDNRMSELIGDNYENNLEHAVKSLDYLIGDFVSFLKKESILENTVLFIAPDHMLPNNRSIKETYQKFENSERSLYLISNKEFISNNKVKTQIETPKILLDTAEIKHNHKFFYEINYIKDLKKYLDDNKTNFSSFNKSIANFIETPEEIKFVIENDNFKIISDNTTIYELDLVNKLPSYINLIFDKNFIFKNDENPKESMSSRKISREDEKFKYKHLTITKYENKIISAKFIDSFDKSMINLRVDNGFVSFDVKNHHKNFKLKNYINDKSRFIAHAGGSIKGQKYLNALEALNKNYLKGLRLFELDLKLTSDGFIVAVHDWEKWKKNSGYRGDIPPSLKNFNNYKIFKKYTPLDYKKINNWFNRNKDAILITDKIKDLNAIKNQIKIDKSRLLIETFSKESLIQFRDNGYKVIANIDSLNEIIDPIDFLNQREVEFISVPHQIKKDLKYNFFNYLKNFLSENSTRQLINNGFKFYAYGLNERKNRITEKEIACKHRDIFFGMYVDNWNFNEPIKCIN